MFLKLFSELAGQSRAGGCAIALLQFTSDPCHGWHCCDTQAQGEAWAFMCSECRTLGWVSAECPYKMQGQLSTTAQKRKGKSSPLQRYSLLKSGPVGDRSPASVPCVIPPSNNSLELILHTGLVPFLLWNEFIFSTSLLQVISGFWLWCVQLVEIALAMYRVGVCKADRFLCSLEDLQEVPELFGASDFPSVG